MHSRNQKPGVTSTPPPGLADSLRHAVSQDEEPDPALVAMAAGPTGGGGRDPPLERASSVNSNSEGGTFAAISRGALELNKRARTATDYSALSGKRKK